MGLGDGDVFRRHLAEHHVEEDDEGQGNRRGNAVDHDLG